jgi:hypothetical protein
MKCPNCQTENEPGARFCANCGNRLTEPRPAPSTRSGEASQVTCPSCGQANPAGSAFCETCGTRLASPQPSAAQTPATTTRPVQDDTAAAPAKKPTSGAWWLLPIIMGWLGGLIGYLVVKDSDQSKAKRLLIFGIAWSVFWIIIYIIALVATSNLIDI